MAADNHCEYTFNAQFEVNEQVLSDFNEYGYILVRKLLDGEELQAVKAALETDKDGILKHAYQVVTEGELKTSLCLWNQPGQDITGMIARVRKTALTMQALLGDEVYHYNTKLMMKQAGEGGWHWHQDFGYWYHNGCLYPDMGTVFIAVDPSKKENGCLQIIESSNKAGRIEHQAHGGQLSADPERVQELQKSLQTKYVELEPGDALFFHCNLLHRSSPNTSKMRRWAFLVAYNTKHNNPYKENRHSKYTKLDIVDNDSIKNYGSETSVEGKEFIPGFTYYGPHILQQ